MHTPYVIVSEKYQMMMSLCKALLTAWVGFSLLCLTQIASSAPIDVRHAQKIASEHLQRVHPLRAEARKVKLLRTNKGLPTRGEKQADYYVFGALQGQGWVLVAGDDALPPVLAYAPKGEFPEELHPEFASVLDKYQHLVKQARLHTGGMQKSPILSPTEEIKPLLDKIRWSQHRPYNQLLPIRTNPKTGEPVQAPTGCGATAIAQVMRYHAWPPKGRGSVTYLGKTIDFSQELPYAWTEMLGHYTKGKYSDAQGEAVARLMHDVGYAAHMKYGAFESGAPPRAMFEALRRYFNYAPTLRYYVISHHSLAESLRILIDELKAGRPVPMDGSTIYNAPHAFVCDGYDGQGLFHINWGWGGDADGYFLIHSVETGNGGGKESYYNLVYGMLIGMQSPARVPNAKEMKEFHCTQALQITTGRFSKKELLTCHVAGIVNQAYSPIVGTHAVILKDAHGKQIHQAHDTTKPFLLKGGQERFRIGKVEIDPKPLKLGKYYLRPAVYDRVDKEYVEATQDPTQKLFSITVTENDVIVAEEEAKPQLSFEVTPVTAPLGGMTTFHLKIANSGTQPYICPIALTLSESQNAPEITDPKTLPFLAWMRIDPGTIEGRTLAIKMPSAGTQHYIHFYYRKE